MAGKSSGQTIKHGVIYGYGVFLAAILEGSVCDMGKYLNTGNAGFEAVRRSIYVDKTEMYQISGNIQCFLLAGW